MNNFKSVTLIFDEFFKYIGLPSFKTELMCDNFGSDYFIFNKNSIKIDYINMNSVDSIYDDMNGKIKEMIDSINNSNFVQPYKNQINKLNQEKEELNKEIERLKQFETHYKLQYNLTHGNKDE